MRTNVVIDDELMQKSLSTLGFRTKREAIEEGLRTMLRIKERQAAFRELRGIGWTGDLDAMRRDKPRPQY